AEKTGDLTLANASYQAVVDHNSTLSPYALWHLARLSRAGGDLVHERELLRRLLALAPQSLFDDAATIRLGQSFYEGGDYDSAANSLRVASSAKNLNIAREAAALLGQSLVHAGKQAEARDVFTRLIMQMPDASRPDDFALTAARELDALDKDSPPKTPLSEADHLLRASIYQFNRDFSGARSHYQTLIDSFP